MMRPLTLLLIGSLILSGCLALSTLGPRTEERGASQIASEPLQPPMTGPDHQALREANVDPETHMKSFDAESRQAIAAALPFLEAEGIAWMDGDVSIQEGQGCVSCHHVPYAVWSHAEARRIGIHGGAAMDQLVDRAVKFVENPSKARAMNLAPLLLGAAQPSEAMQGLLQRDQESDGKWRARGQFPSQRRPVETSNAVATRWSLLALALGDLETDNPEAGDTASRFSGSEVDRNATAWLAKSEPGDDVEDLATGLLIASLSETEKSEAWRAQLLAAQNVDGGWPWAKGEPSNALSTGQALYSLAWVSADGVSSGARDRGLSYLLESQEADGFWLLPSGLISEEESADRDVIYRYWGTAWAVIGLARSL